MTTTIKLLKVDPVANNNKFYEVTLDADGDTVHARWGRVGANGQSKDYTGGQRQVDKLVKGKKRKGYQEVDIVGSGPVQKVANTQLKRVASQSLVQEKKRRAKTASTDLESLIDRLVTANAHDIMEASSGQVTIADGVVQTPLGIIGKGSIDEARTIINRVKPGSKAADNLAVEYARIVPQNVGMRRGWHEGFWTTEKIDQERDFLDRLEASVDWYETQADQQDENSTDAFADLFSYKVDIASKREFDRIKRVFEKSVNRSHLSSNLQLRKVYVLASDTTDFDARAADIGNIQELWHGTGVHNVLSIMRKGLYCPKPGDGVAITGRMFGDGVYFSAQSTKSLNYATGFWGNVRRSNRDCFMFLADVAMGTEFRPRRRIDRSEYQALYTGKPLFGNVRHSINVKPGHAGVRNHEAIVWNTNQIKLSYLCEFGV